MLLELIIIKEWTENMKKLITIITLVVLSLILSACNMPGYQEEMPEESDDLMATEIARILTGTPVEVNPTSTSAPVEADTAYPVTTEEATEPPITEEEVTLEETEELITEEPTDTPEPTLTPTQAPTATLADTDPALTLGAPDWVDPMDDGDNWPTGFNEYTSIEFEDGFLKLSADTDLDGWRLSWPYLEDFYIEATILFATCEGSDHTGLMFRVPEDSNANAGYLFGITCDGRYSLRLWDGKNMSYPVNWTESDAIKTGEDTTNVLGVMAVDSNLALFINGVKVKEISNDAFTEGQFGIFVGGTITDLPEVWVNQIRYWEIP
jgi:hypothetical protein